ncbi:hypothetical protein TNCT_225061 [Trichonephila clavata]|uniref:Tc1-like transposase DDE domain-containing protein n=1 Tax=Trichonephila clavata TaxID=2740835 RepID=A0A8X6L5S3_TRICU|nr:hypothetical protein TNCT_225061 [Trichonephila clavata]
MLLIFLLGKKSGDYHEEMDGNPFETWLETIMPKLKLQIVIVMDNAPYHSVKKEKIPTSSWKKVLFKSGCHKRKLYGTKT